MRGLSGAVAVAGRGYRVFPVGEDKKPYIKGWVSEATDDRDTLERWWTRWPEALVGILTGHGLVVVDLDVKNGQDGPTEWRTWCVQNNVRLVNRTVRSRSEGGGHIYLRMTPRAGNRGGLMPGVDIKGDGGSVVAWELPPPFADLPEAPGPVEALLSSPEPAEQPAPGPIAPERDPALGEHPYAEASVKRELERLDACDMLGWGGEPWDDTTYRVACNLIEFGNSAWSGYSREQAYADFLEHAPTDAGFGRATHEEKWDSAVKRIGEKGRPDPDTDPSMVFDVVGDEPGMEPVVREPVAADLRVLVEREKLRLQARRLAEKELRDAETVQGELPRVVGLDTFLDEPDEPTMYRVQGFWPTAGRVVLAAQFKAGKTTLVGNVVRCLVDGEPFLDQFFVGQAGRVLLADNEMSPGQLRVWLRDQKTQHPEWVGLVSLRGNVSSFNILDERIRERWANHLGAADVLIFDCLRPVLDALALDENKDAGRFLVALDELAQQAGIKEVLLVHHMGHNNERSRGDSRILDWPDATWNLVMGDGGARYLSARGRDVDQPEMQLDMDPTTRHLSAVGGSRAEQKATDTDDEVLAAVNAKGPQSGRDLEEALGRVARAAIKRLVASGQLKQSIRKGQGGGYEYTV